MPERSLAYTTPKPGKLSFIPQFHSLPPRVIHAHSKTLGEFLKRERERER